MTTTPDDAPNWPPRPTAVAGPPEPIRWPSLTDDLKLKQIEELTAWITWVKWRFTLDHRAIPDCWLEHGPHVEELSALYVSWQATYRLGADADGPLRWMEHFAAARARLADWTARTGCRPGEHRVK